MRIPHIFMGASSLMYLYPQGYIPALSLQFPAEMQAPNHWRLSVPKLESEGAGVKTPAPRSRLMPHPELLGGC